MFSLLMLRKRRTVAPQIIGITLLQYVSALDVAKTLNGSTANPWNSTFTWCFASWCCESVERSHRKSSELHFCIMFRLLMLRKCRTVAPRTLGISLLHYVLLLDVAKTQNGSSASPWNSIWEIMFCLLMLRKRKTVAQRIVGVSLFTLCFASWCCENAER